jgi:hypothetical protein
LRAPVWRQSDSLEGGGGRGDVRTVPMMARESENEAEAGPVGRRVTKPSGKVFGLEWCN